MTIISNPVKYNTGAGVGGTSGGAGTSGYTIGNAGSSNVTLTNTSGVGLSSGQIYTTNGTVTSTWITPNNYDQVLKVNAGKDTPTLEVQGRMVINGRDLEERLKTIETLLQIPERDVKLERKHPKLKKLYDEYITALGKYRTFEAIKGDEDGTA